MRTLALVLLAVSLPPSLADTTPTLLTNTLACAFNLGPAKCINALSAWRARRAIETTSKHNLIQDLKQFPWNQYTNSTNEDLYSELCDSTEKLLQQQSMTLAMPGYKLELLSKGNGTLNVDVYKSDGKESGRGSMKKAQKQFYKILPFLMVPGLIMSAILPFVLPALKLMVVGVGMLNNMALSGAIFTLMRNNAFNDRYEHKVIYVNHGYKNEKHASHHKSQEHVFDYEDGYESRPVLEYAVPDGFEVQDSFDGGWSQYEVPANKFTGKVKRTSKS